MKSSRDNEGLIVLAGVGVLATSLLLPLAQRLAAEHDMSDVAARASEVKEKLLSSAEPGKPLRVGVSNLVDGLSPDAALADAEMRPEKDVLLDAVPVVARPEGDGAVAAAVVDLPEGVGIAGGDEVVAEPVVAGDEVVAEPVVDPVEQMAASEPARRSAVVEPIAPRDGDHYETERRSGAAWIWAQ